MKPSRTIALGLGALAIGVAATLAYLAAGTAQAAPDVGYVRLDGSKARTGDFKGKVVLVNFWSTSCATCVKEMPQIAATHQKYRARGYDTLAVAMQDDMPAYVVNFTESRKLPFTVTMDTRGEIASRFGGVKATPTSLLINKRGEIVKRYVGEPDFAALHTLVEKLLAEEA
jgi:peroxiredoxin